MARRLGVVLFILLSQLLSSYSVHSRTIVENLPGFDDPLPFKLETGYVGIGQNEDIQLLYYFVESGRNPNEDPLMLWIAGGPVCSTLGAFFRENGPLQFDYKKSTEEKPVLELNPYSWTKVLNIIYLDTPVGAGFSYAKSYHASKTSDTLSSKHVYEFLRKWLNDHRRFMSNPFYMGGVSYSGITIPLIIQEIHNGNEDGNRPEINLKGFLIGNPLTDRNIDFNSRIPYAYKVALISGQLYESAKEHCSGDYINSKNALCARDLRRVDECLEFIYDNHILEPVCASSENAASNPLLLQPLSRSWCREDNYVYNVKWANDDDVQRALGIRQGIVKDWVQCNGDHYEIGKNDTDTYSYNAESSLPYHRNMTRESYRALIFSGDHDSVFPHVGTEIWIQSLNLTVESEWAPWFVDQQVAGYQTTYSHNNYSLTYATVKGAGHTASEYKPKECLVMVDRWFTHNSLKSVNNAMVLLNT
ncbi:hypothetical protein ACET3Z_030675 [Daucus carota]